MNIHIGKKILFREELFELGKAIIYSMQQESLKMVPTLS
jgi:hypothetical protein